MREANGREIVGECDGRVTVIVGAAGLYKCLTAKAGATNAQYEHILAGGGYELSMSQNYIFFITFLWQGKGWLFIVCRTGDKGR